MTTKKASFAPVVIEPKKPKSLQVIELNKAAMQAVAAGNMTKAMKLMTDAAAINATISHRGSGEGSEASIAKHEVKVTSVNLKTDGYYRVVGGKLFSLPTGKQTDGASFVIPRYKAAGSTPVIATPAPAKKAPAKKAPAKKAAPEPAVAE